MRSPNSISGGRGLPLFALTALTAIGGCGSSLESDLASREPTDAITSRLVGMTPGIAGMTSFAELPKLQPTTRAGHESSFDRTGGNIDYDIPTAETNDLGVDAHGDRIVLDQHGPGVLNRIWTTFYGSVSGQVLKIYFDNETTPRVNSAAPPYTYPNYTSLFAGTQSPLLAPLVWNFDVSSGGYYSYLPMPFEQHIRVTIGCDPGATGCNSTAGYYNFDYHLLDPTVPLTTFTGTEDTAAARNAWWESGGADPKGDDSDPTVSAATGHVTLASGGTTTLLDTTGPRSLSSIRLKLQGVVPGVVPEGTNWSDENTSGTVLNAQDEGRAHKGTSTFVMAVNPANQGVFLKRRLDYGVANQMANVEIMKNGVWQFVGTWSNAGSDSVYRWRDASFFISPTYTQGLSSIKVRVSFVSSAGDWNEFRYWTTSLVNGAEEPSDELDVGIVASENAHSYVITTQTWTGQWWFWFSPDATSPPQGPWNGRAHQGSEHFTVAVAANARGTVLKRRMDYGVADQTANVYVAAQAAPDGNGDPCTGVTGWQLAGVWSTPGSDSANRWRDSAFIIPPALTAGMASLCVRVDHTGGLDWNTFGYSVFSSMANRDALTDSIDFDVPNSILTHHYKIDSGQTWAGPRTFRFPPRNASAAALNNLWLRITWDSESTPGVYAPLGSFFGVGALGAALNKSLLLGMKADGELYAYFPMPFQQRARVELVNNGATAAPAIDYVVKHKPFMDTFTDVGYFRTQYRATTSVPGQDLVFADLQGRGHIVGLVESVAGPPKTLANGWDPLRYYLEGDDHVLIDDARTPWIHGTGTEDMFNGGWYFINGPFTLASHGNTKHVKTWVGADSSGDKWSDSTSMYRLFIGDRIPFRRSVRFSAEHGQWGNNAGTTANDEQVSAWTLVHYYQQPAVASVKSDELSVGNSTSMTAHGYATSGTYTSRSSCATPAAQWSFEGEVNTTYCFAGRSYGVGANSSFTMAINPSNRGVLLRRTFDQATADQHASVTVDGTPIGEFYKAGKNLNHRWREEEVFLPASVTSGKSSISIQVLALSSWNESEYKVYSILP